MRFIIISYLILFFPTNSFADTKTIIGKWARNDGIARVEIYQCGANICAKNFWIKSGVKEEKVGDLLIMSLKPNGANNFLGKANDPQRNLTYKIKIMHQTSTMTTKGCILGGFICKTVGWKRI